MRRKNRASLRSNGFRKPRERIIRIRPSLASLRYTGNVIYYVICVTGVLRETASVVRFVNFDCSPKSVAPGLALLSRFVHGKHWIAQPVSRRGAELSANPASGCDRGPIVCRG